MRDRHIDERAASRTQNQRNAEKRMRSATEPATSATVMIANVIW